MLLLGREEALRSGVEPPVVVGVTRGRVVRSPGSLLQGELLRDVTTVVVEDLDWSVLSDPVGHLVRIDPERQRLREVFEDLADAQSAQLGGKVEDRVDLGVAQLDASIPRPLERLLGVPVTVELLAQALLQFLAEHVDAASRKFVVQVGDDEVESDG